MKVFFVGAGPGDPELITVKGQKLIDRADIIIYAGSLVNPALLPGEDTTGSCGAEGLEIYDSASMALEEVTAVYSANKGREGTIVRLHTGDPALYGAIQEQIDFCRDNGISFEVVPGVSSFSAAAAVLEQELTLPGVSQSVILSRISGRTKTPPAEDIGSLASHRTSMVLFLSAGKLTETVGKLREGYPPETPVAVVYRASWPDQKIVRGTLSTIEEKTKEAGITRQALIVVGRVLEAAAGADAGSPDTARHYEKSKLYDPGFTHGYRTARGKEGENDG
jgi:precorrin-4/cobalt-precorrin-4 C11-methyltransferase